MLFYYNLLFDLMEKQYKKIQYKINFYSMNITF